MTNNWQTVKLGDVCENVTSGGTPTSTKKEYYLDGNIPWLNTKEVNFNRIYNTEKYITELGLSKSSAKWIKKNSIIVAMYGATAGRVAITKIPVTTNQACCNIAVDSQRVDYNYIYYFLCNSYIKLSSMANGGAQQNLNSNNIKNFEVQFPPLPEQERIAGVLSALDDKIENNSAINKKLEEMAQAIFKSYFIDFTPFNGSMPQDWQEGTISDIVSVIDNRGKTPPLELNITDYPIIDVRALAGNSRIVNYSNCTKYVSEDVYNNWFRNGHPLKLDILISTVGSLAEMKLFYGNKGCIAQNVVAFRSKGISPYFIYQYLLSIKDKLISYNIGSVQPSIKVSHVVKHKLFIPNNDTLNKYHLIAKSLSEKIYANQKENEKLTQLRDSLLPKLMSGVLRV